MDCIRLDGKLTVAKFSNDVASMDQISDSLATANNLRATLREAIRSHEATHTKTSSAQGQ